MKDKRISAIIPVSNNFLLNNKSNNLQNSTMNSDVNNQTTKTKDKNLTNNEEKNIQNERKSMLDLNKDRKTSVAKSFNYKNKITEESNSNKSNNSNLDENNRKNRKLSNKPLTTNASQISSKSKYQPRNTVYKQTSSVSKGKDPSSKAYLLQHKEREKQLLKNCTLGDKIKIESMINKNMIEIKKNCHDHEAYLDHFCFDCGHGVCRYCLTLQKHEGHIAVEKKLFDLRNPKLKTKLFGSLSEDLQKILGNTLLKDTDVDKTNKDPTEKKNNSMLNENMYTEYKQLLETKFSEIIEDIINLKAKKLEELKTIFENNKTLIANFDYNLQMGKEKYDFFVKNYRDLIPNEINNDIIFLQNFDIYSTGVQCLNESSYIIQYIKNFKTKFLKDVESISRNIKVIFEDIKNKDIREQMLDIDKNDSFYKKFTDKLKGNIKFIEKFIRKFINTVNSNTNAKSLFTKTLNTYRSGSTDEAKNGKLQSNYIKAHGIDTKKGFQNNLRDSSLLTKTKDLLEKTKERISKNAEKRRQELKSKSQMKTEDIILLNNSEFNSKIISPNRSFSNEKELNVDKNIKDFVDNINSDLEKKTTQEPRGNRFIFKLSSGSGEAISRSNSKAKIKKSQSNEKISKDNILKPRINNKSSQSLKSLKSTSDKDKLNSTLQSNNSNSMIDDVNFLINVHKKAVASRAYLDQSYKYNYFYAYITNYCNHICGDPIKVTLMVEEGRFAFSKNMNSSAFTQPNFASQESNITGSFFALLLKHNHSRKNKSEINKSSKNIKDVENKGESKVNKTIGAQEGLELFKPVEGKIYIILGTSKIQLYDSDSKVTFRMELESVFELKTSDKFPINERLPYSKFPEGLRSIMVGMSIYIFGGRDVDKEYNSVLKYDIDKQQLSLVCNMNYERSYFSLIIDEDKANILLIGGENNCTCEIFDLVKQKCFIAPFMNYPRSNATVYIHQCNYLYVFGGFKYGLHCSEKQGSIERIELSRILNKKEIKSHSEHGYWEKLNLKNEFCIDLRYDYISITPFTNNYIFLCGGFVSRTHERSVSLLDLTTNKLSVLDEQTLNLITDKLLNDPQINVIFDEVFKK